MNHELRDLLSDVFEDHGSKLYVLFLGNAKELLLAKRGAQDPEYMLCVRDTGSSGMCDDGTLRTFEDFDEAIVAVVETVSAHRCCIKEDAEHWLLNELQA